MPWTQSSTQTRSGASSPRPDVVDELISPVLAATGFSRFLSRAFFLLLYRAKQLLLRWPNPNGCSLVGSGTNWARHQRVDLFPVLTANLDTMLTLQ